MAAGGADDFPLARFCLGVSAAVRWQEAEQVGSDCLEMSESTRGSELRRYQLLADLGLPQGALALALLGFNLGVEVGQLAIVAAFLPLAYLLRRTVFYRRVVLQGGSALIALLAAVWLLERVFELELMPF